MRAGTRFGALPESYPPPPALYTPGGHYDGGMQWQRTQRRAGGGVGPALRLLLFVAVLLGVGAMHTLGHFEGHGHAGHAASGAAADSTGASGGAQHSAPQGPAVAGLAEPGSGGPAASAGHPAGAAGTEGAAGPETPGQQHSSATAAGADGSGLPPLDPASVCLALAGLALAALHLAVSALPRTPAPAAAPVRGGRTRAPSAERPPAPPSLSALQVLRI
ncbi:hypothetical protein GCM10027440_16180 [Nocardiopsis coralliicola]